MPDPITIEVKFDPDTTTDILLRLIPVVTAHPPHVKGEFGIDVSRHQGVIDWDRVAAALSPSRVMFVGIRATLGTGIDDKFQRNWAEAKRVGIQRLAYHYFVNNFPALPQINNFLSVVGSDMGELPMVLDVEPTSGQVIVNKTANTTEILSWLIHCEYRARRRPAIYTNGWAWSACTTVPGWSADYPLWLAQYTAAPVPTIPNPWTRYMAWQYSSTGTLSGIAGNVDLNRWGEYP